MRAPNLQTLTDAIKAEFPGVVIYGVGNDAHKLRPSDHNEDDSGLPTEQTDGDNIPEHRAIDVMLGAALSKDEAQALVNRLIADPASKKRIRYIIFYDFIYSASRDFKPVARTTDPHRDHIHISGYAAEDANTDPWPAVRRPSTPPPTPPSVDPSHPTLRQGMTGEYVRRLQQFLRNTFPAYRNSVSYLNGTYISTDGNFGPQTTAWVKEFQRRVGILRDGIVGPTTLRKLREHGYKY